MSESVINPDDLPILITSRVLNSLVISHHLATYRHPAPGRMPFCAFVHSFHRGI